MTLSSRRSTLLPLFALACAALTASDAFAVTRASRTPRPASSAPGTEQLLAPSASTRPDELPVDAQVYRCGNSYSPHPCEGARQIDVADPRTQAQRAQAADVAARDKRLAAWLEAGRRERETVATTKDTKRPRAKTPAEKPCKPTRTRACEPEAAASIRYVLTPKPAKGAGP